MAARRAANLAIGEIAQPGLFKIFATNPSNAKFVFEEFLLPHDSPVRQLAKLKGKRVASGPGIQNVTAHAGHLVPAQLRSHEEAESGNLPARSTALNRHGPTTP